MTLYIVDGTSLICFRESDFDESGTVNVGGSISYKKDAAYTDKKAALAEYRTNLNLKLKSLEGKLKRNKKKIETLTELQTRLEEVKDRIEWKLRTELLAGDGDE